MSKRLRKPVKKGKDFRKIIKILSQSAIKHSYKQIGAKLEVDDRKQESNYKRFEDSGFAK
jgi:uncharacterized protein YegL